MHTGTESGGKMLHAQFKNLNKNRNVGSYQHFTSLKTVPYKEFLREASKFREKFG